MPFVPGAVCLKCNEAMTVDKIGLVAQMFAHERSYYKISGDVLKCPKCGARILSRFGNAMENFTANYKNIVSDISVQLEKQPKPQPENRK